MVRNFEEEGGKRQDFFLAYTEVFARKLRGVVPHGQLKEEGRKEHHPSATRTERRHQ